MFWYKIISAVIVLSALLGVADGQNFNASICTPNTDSGVKPFPTIPDVFASHMSLHKVDQKTTESLLVQFDAPNQRAYLGVTEATGPEKNETIRGSQIFNFFNKQIVTFLQTPPGVHACYAADMSTNGSDVFMFGGEAAFDLDYSAKKAFRINDTAPPRYVGREILNDTMVLVDHWEDCVYLDSLDATVIVDYYFTASEWVTPMGKVAIPLMIMVKGHANKGGVEGKSINNVYTFNQFQDFLSDHDLKKFQIPQHTACPYLKPFRFDSDDKDKHEMPRIAPNGYFQFHAELIQKSVGSNLLLVTNVKEIHDERLQMSRYDYNPSGVLAGFNVPGANQPLTEVHDFRTGLVYVINRDKGNCSFGPLSSSPNFDVVTVDSRHTRMKTVQEFFRLTKDSNSDMEWTYIGPRKDRGMTVESYVARIYGVPVGDNSTFQLDFMSSDELEVDFRATDVQYEEPVKMWQRTDGSGEELTYNIFNYDEDEPAFQLYDVSDCYADNQKQEWSFRLSGSNMDLIESNKQEFYYLLLISLMQNLKIPPSRLSNIQPEATANGQSLLVRFTLLDPPSLFGSVDSLPEAYTKSSHDIIANLRSLIDSNKFEVGDVGDLNITSFISLKAIQGSLAPGPDQGRATPRSMTCTPKDIQGLTGNKSFPKIPDVYSTHVSLFKLDSNLSVSIYEQVDGPNDRAYLRQHVVNGSMEKTTVSKIYNFYGRQIVTLEETSPGYYTCGTSSMNNTPDDTIMFGYLGDENSRFSSKSAFWIDERNPPKYQGQTTIGGMEVDWWKDCIQLKLNSTITVEWYFIAGSWASVPIMMKVYGSLHSKHSPDRYIDHFYTFSNYQDFLTSHQITYFEIPDKTFCPNLRPYKTESGGNQPHFIPTFASKGYFKCYAELVQRTAGNDTVLVTSMKDVYDVTLNLSRYDLNPTGFSGRYNRPGTATPYTIVHDFSAGVQYVIDSKKRNCTASSLTSLFSFDSYQIDNHPLRMKSIQELFLLTDEPKSSVKWTYIGSKKVRGIPVDSYTTFKTDQQGGDNSTLQIDFMSSGSIMVNHGGTRLESKIPIQISFRDQNGSTEFDYNIFAFDEDEPSSEEYDVADCFTEKQKQHVTFKLPSSSKAIMKSNRDQLHYLVMSSLVRNLDLPPIRISKLQFEVAKEDGNILVSFTVLDRPTVFNDMSDELRKKYLTSSSTVVGKLQTLVENGGFEISDGTPHSIVLVKAVVGSVNKPLANTPADPKVIVKIDQGATAGVGITLLLVGFGLGILTIFLISRYRRQSLPHFSFRFSRSALQEEE